MLRLMEAARNNCGCSSWADLGRYIGESDQTLTNWKTRGIPADKYLSLAAMVKTNPYWLESGNEHLRTVYPTADESIAELVHVAEELPEEYQRHLIKQGKDLVDLMRMRNLHQAFNPAADVAFSRKPNQTQSLTSAPEVRKSRSRKTPEKDT